jgi:DNA polymerase III sliding clamp (beta) subunit (PCNA family)
MDEDNLCLSALLFIERKKMNPMIELPVGDLKGVLTGIGKVINGRSTLPVLGTVKFAPEANGCLSISGTDLETHVTAQLGLAKNCEPVLVPLEPLSRLVKSLPASDRLTIRKADKTHALLGYQLAGTRVEQSVESLSLDEWPSSTLFTEAAVPVDDTFKQALRQALECSSDDSTRYVLNGVCIDITQPDCHCLVGTDGRHLYSANTFRLDLKTSVIIPDRKFLNWSPFYDDGNWSLSVETDKEEKPAWIRIQSDHWTYLTKAIDGTYPNWRQVIVEPGPKSTRVILTEESVNLMLDVLPRLPGMNDLCRSISLVLKSSGMVVRGRDRAPDDWTEVPVPGVTIHGPDNEVGINRTYLTKALRFGFTEFTVHDPLTPVVFTAPGRTLLVMPVRLDGAPATPNNTPPPPEAAESTSPSVAQPDNPTDQRNAMASTTTTSMTPPERGNLKPATNGETQSAISAVVEHVEEIKTKLRDVIGDLTKTIDLLKAAEKEKKATLKEVETVRATLRSLQKVDL